MIAAATALSGNAQELREAISVLISTPSLKTKLTLWGLHATEHFAVTYSTVQENRYQMDKEIEAIIAQEAGLGGRNSSATDEIEIEEENRQSDAYTDADEREEQIELMNDTIDTLVDESQDASTEGVDNDGWDHN
jgi:hypothetical protein